MKALLLTLIGAAILTTGVACASTSSEIPEEGSYGVESPAGAMQEEEEEASWRDADR